MQGIYARAFYAASDTRTPAITGTLITALSVPMYWALFHAHSASKAWPSRPTSASSSRPRRSPSCCTASAWSQLAHLEFAELGRALLAALLAFAATAAAAHFLPPISAAITATVAHVLPPVSNYARYLRDLFTIAIASLAWATAALLTLLATGSKLPAQILRRR